MLHKSISNVVQTSDADIALNKRTHVLGGKAVAAQAGVYRFIFTMKYLSWHNHLIDPIMLVYACSRPPQPL